MHTSEKEKEAEHYKGLKDEKGRRQMLDRNVYDCVHMYIKVNKSLNKS